MADNKNIDPTKIPFNTLNDVSQPIGGKRERMDGGTDFMDAVVNASQNQFISDALQNTGPYKAIVLRVEKDSQTSEPGSWLSNTFNSFFGDPPQIVKIKARIPEIHAALPIPNRVGSDDGPHQPIIDLYPTFMAQDSQIEEPKPGDIVNVDFGNKNTYSDPIYLGPLLKTSAFPGAFGPQSGAGLFGDCGAATPIPQVSAPQLDGSTPQITGTLDPNSELLIDPFTGLPTNANNPDAESITIEEFTGSVLARAPEFIFGFQGGVSDPDLISADGVPKLGSVYVFGDSNTQGQHDAMGTYFSSRGFEFYLNSWYGGAYRIAYVNTPERLVKDNNSGNSIESYKDQFQYGDTVIIGSIGGNASFFAREAFPSKVPVEELAAGTLFGPVEEPLLGPVQEPEHPKEASEYNLQKYLPDETDSFTRFCEILLELKMMGVNVIIFGLPYGGAIERQKDREWFDYVQLASLSAFGLGKNYVSVMQLSKLLKAGDKDVHYFTGNGGSGYQAYFDLLLRPYLDSFYQLYEETIAAASPIPFFLLEDPSETGFQISLPDTEKPSENTDAALENLLKEIQDSNAAPVTPPTSPAVPSQACIGPVGGSGGAGNNTAGGAGGSGFTGGGGSVGKATNFSTEPFNGGKTDVIVLNGVEYAFSGIRGADQFKTNGRKEPVKYLVIHNSVTPYYSMMVHCLRYKKDTDEESPTYGQTLLRGLGVHFTVDTDGYMFQHADPMVHMVSHGTPLNAKSVGIETITSFYWKDGVKKGAKAPWHDKHQVGKGFTPSEPHWWMGTNKGYLYARPPEVMIESCNRLMDFLFNHMPDLQLQFPSKDIPRTDDNSKVSGDPGAGLLSHRDYVAKSDGRYFMERYIEHRTGQKLLEFH